MTYEIKYKEDGKRKGWVIIVNDTYISNDHYFPTREDAEKKRELLLAFWGDE